MSDKRARKFDKLLEGHKVARQKRKRAAAARRQIKGLNGRCGAISALASPTGAKAIAAELEALKVERRALQKLFAFALKYANDSVSSNGPKVAEGRAKKTIHPR